MKVWIARLSALLCVFFAAGAFAQNTYTAYIDADGRTNTGCTVTLPGGTFTGADFRLQATVTTGSSPQVTNVTLAQCVNGSFGAGTHVGGGYPVGLNVGVGGADAIEFSSSAAGMFGPGTNAAVLGFTAESATGSDVLFTTNGTNTGSPILFAITLPIPALGAGALALLALLVAVIARRKGYGRLYGRMLALSFFALCGMALAATFASDGNVNDWNGIPPVATDPTGDPTNGSPDIDLVAAFAAYQNNTIYFRVDVKDVQTQAPTITSANSTQFIVGEAGTFSVASTGVPSPALTLTGCTLPANLTFVDNGNGTGTLAGTPAAGTAGTYNCTITASNGIPPDATQPFTLTVANAPSTTTLGANPPSPSVFGQSVTFTATVTATPPAVGTPTGTVTFLDNGSSIGTGTLSGGVATLTTGALAVGSTHSITAQYGGDSNFGTSTSSALPYTVNQDGTTTALNANPNPSMFNQNVTFTATVTATAPGAGTPTGTVTFKDGSTTLGPGTLTGGVATFSTSTLSVGPHTITAQYGGDVDFTGSTSTTVNQTVNQANQTITFTSTAPAAATVGGPTYTATATATSGLAVSLTIDATATSVCSISGSTVSFIGAGTCVIDANQAGNGNYTAAPQVQQSFVVGKGSQTISFTSTAPAAATVAGPTYTVTATATSGLAVAFTIDATATSVCSISGSTVSFIGAGTCVIDANQAGNANYNAAPQVQQSFTVGKGSQTISFTSTAPVGAAVAGPTYTVTATATSGLAVTFTIDATATSVCSISGSTVSFIGAGTCVIDANQAGNANYNAAPQVQQSFAVAKGSQTISFTSTAPVGASVGGPTYTATATATSGLAVTLTIDATATSVCSISGSTVSFIGAGTCVIDANQPGNANYTAAPQVQQSFAVAKGSQTIS
ncbi:MAG TPA: Ig-like domain repeat protein, partial [Rudaea sp.]|nr:Ig-like domain repeat protein [Rudaea sp.]